MTFEDVANLQKHWAKYPPTHLALYRIERLIGRAAGAEVSDDPGPQKDVFNRMHTEEELRSFVAQLNG